MTIFGIHFLNPAALGLLGLSVPLILLYLLKMKRVQRVTSSNLLWLKVVNDIQATHPFQKLQRNLLLLLQLLALLLLAGALARPTFAGSKVEGTSIVLVVDTSASMKAMDGHEQAGKQSRFEAAKDAARQVIEQIPTADEPLEIMIVEAGGTIRVRQGFTSDRGALHRALDAMEPTDRSTNLVDALRLAAATLKTRARPEIVLLTDGAGTDVSELADLPPTRYVRLGRRNDNVAVTLFDARPASPRRLEELRAAGQLETGRFPYSIFAAIRNFGKKDRKVYATLTFEKELIAAEHVDLPAEGETSVVFEQILPPGIVRLEVEAEDLLAADNVAHAVVRPISELRAALVTAGNPFLERALKTLPYVESAVVKHEDLLKTGPWDLVVLDRVVPDPLPDTHLLLIRPGRPLDGFEPGDLAKFPDILDWRTDHPLLRSVVFSDVHIAEVVASKGEPRGDVLARGTGGVPLMIFRQEPGRSFRVLLPFHIADTDWALRPSFPIFMSNLMQMVREFSTVTTAPYFKTGTVISLPALSDDIRVTAPDGRTHAVRRAEAMPYGYFAATDFAGIYTAQWGADRRLRFAVNIVDARESNLEPAQDLKVGGRTIAGEATLRQVNEEAWPWLAIVILAIALFEWYAFHRKLGY